jgi:hypothetical protein
MTKLRKSAHCVTGVINVEVRHILGALTFRLQTLNLRQKVQSNPDILQPDFPTQY